VCVHIGLKERASYLGRKRQISRKRGIAKRERERKKKIHGEGGEFWRERERGKEEYT
jgi:hypothetical protein